MRSAIITLLFKNLQVQIPHILLFSPFLKGAKSGGGVAPVIFADYLAPDFMAGSLL